MAHPYRLDADAAAFARALGVAVGDDPWAGGSVVPGGYAPVVIREGPRRRIVPRQWGVPPPPRVDRTITHIRNLESPFWIGTLRHTQFRCLVPATAIAVSRAGRMVWCGVPGRPVMALAGIWRDSEVPSFALVSVDGEGIIAGAGAMPVVLDPADYQKWLSSDWKDAQKLVTPSLDVMPMG